MAADGIDDKRRLEADDIEQLRVRLPAFAAEGCQMESSKVAWRQMIESLCDLALKGLNTPASATHDTVSVPRSLAERSEAMFRSVDPEGCIAQEWKSALADSTGLPTKE